MTKRLVSVHRDSYRDSVRLLEATRALQGRPGVIWGTALMATPANVESLVAAGFGDEMTPASANDLMLAVLARDEDTAEGALEAASGSLFNSNRRSDANDSQEARDLRSAIALQPRSNVAVISTPGPFATLEAQKALTAGLHVLLFSDNVPLEDEIALKQRGRQLGRFVMGPGAGTALLGGVGLGFANRACAGPVGVVAASGTGAQEAVSLLERCGVGVSCVIGVGGRDLSEDVGGLMTEMAIHALEADADTQAILLVSKPPSPAVTARMLALPEKPMVACLIGPRTRSAGSPAHVLTCDTLEGGVVHMLAALGKPPADFGARELVEKLTGAMATLTVGRKRLVGLYSGGTLCCEAMVIACQRLGPIYSNIPIDAFWSIETAAPDAHICLDLGEESFTHGRPHPMIDAGARATLLQRQTDDSSVAVVLFDVVLGDGAHPDPASVLAPVAAKVVQSGAVVVVHVLGTKRDPQGLEAQRRRFADAGCIVAESAARAALAAVAVVLRDPMVALDPLSPAFAPSVRINPENQP